MISGNKTKQNNRFRIGTPGIITVTYWLIKSLNGYEQSVEPRNITSLMQLGYLKCKSYPSTDCLQDKEHILNIVYNLLLKVGVWESVRIAESEAPPQTPRNRVFISTQLPSYAESAHLLTILQEAPVYKDLCDKFWFLLPPHLCPPLPFPGMLQAPDTLTYLRFTQSRDCQDFISLKASLIPLLPGASALYELPLQFTLSHFQIALLF